MSNKEQLEKLNNIEELNNLSTEQLKFILKETKKERDKLFDLSTNIISILNSRHSRPD